MTDGTNHSRLWSVTSANILPMLPRFRSVIEWLGGLNRMSAAVMGRPIFGATSDSMTSLAILDRESSSGYHLLFLKMMTSPSNVSSSAILRVLSRRLIIELAHLAKCGAISPFCLSSKEGSTKWALKGDRVPNCCSQSLKAAFGWKFHGKWSTSTCCLILSVVSQYTVHCFSPVGTLLLFVGGGRLISVLDDADCADPLGNRSVTSGRDMTSRNRFHETS